MKKKNLFRLLWLPILMASVGIIGLSTQISFRLPSFSWGTKPAIEAHIIATVAIYDSQTGAIVGWWDYYDDGTKKWRPWPGTNPVTYLTTDDKYVVDLIYTKNKKRPAEKIFRA